MAETRTHRARPWRFGVAAALALLPLCPGCRCRPPEAREDRRYTDGMRLFLAGSYGAAAPVLRQFVAEQPSNPRVAEAQYALGAIALKSGQPQEAQARFRACLGCSPSRQLAASAAVGLARCHLQRGAYAECKEACLEILRGDPACPRADEVLFLLAEAAERSRQATEAVRIYRKLVAEFRGSPWAQKAEARLTGRSPEPEASPSGQYSVQVVAFASEEKASEHAGLLRGRRYPASVVKVRSGGSNLYTVRVGPYASRADAQRVASRLRAEGFEPIVKP
jgi:TolA-binding protein